MTLTLVHSRKVACWPWELRQVCEGLVVGAICRMCDRDVALPRDHDRETPLCLYCALDDGTLPAEDAPLGTRLDAFPADVA